MDCFLFFGLDNTEIEQVNRRLGKPETVKKGGELYRTGALGILITGTARIYRHGGTGMTVTIRSLLKGDVFGAASVFGEWADGSSSIIADTACTVGYLPEKLLKELMTDIPKIAFNTFII
jgi:CRP-like cAMP-binding protein